MIIFTFVAVAKGQSQAEMNAKAFEEYTKADEEMNKIYKEIIKNNKDKLFIEKLRMAQRAWLVYRDAHMKEAYPVPKGKNPKELYGSIYPMCYHIELTRVTVERTKLLNGMVGGGCN